MRKLTLIAALFVPISAMTQTQHMVGFKYTPTIPHVGSGGGGATQYRLSAKVLVIDVMTCSGNIDTTYRYDIYRLVGYKEEVDAKYRQLQNQEGLQLMGGGGNKECTLIEYYIVYKETIKIEAVK